MTALLVPGSAGLSGHLKVKSGHDFVLSGGRNAGRTLWPFGFVFDGRAGAGRLLQPPKLWGGDKVMASGVSCFALFDVKLFRGKNKKKDF